VWKPTATGNGFVKSAGGSTFTSFENGRTIPGALDLEFDFPVYPFATPQGQSLIRVWGIGLGMIGQSANLNFQNFKLYAGMKPGLPLATAAAPQAGLIAQGKIFQAFGNWEGINQTLDLIVNPGAAGMDQDIHFKWAQNSPLSGAIKTMLAQAFPQYPNPTINIGDSLRLPNDEDGHYQNLAQLADYLQQITSKVGVPIYGENYPGVQITIVGNSINVYDGTKKPKVTAIAFQDLVGQPTWIGSLLISFKTPLRSDLTVGSAIRFPIGVTSPFALTSQAAAFPNAPASSKTVFSGNFIIKELHHFARYRQADAQSWNTSYVAFPAFFRASNP
jgi:hypothetical protein